MARTKKCYECRKDCDKNTMIHLDYLDKNGNVKTKSYCSVECVNAKEKRKELIDKTNDLLDVMLEMPVRENIYFNKLYSPIVKHYGYDLINDMLLNEYSNISEALSKDFVNPNVKIKYFMAIVQNKIEEYKNIEKENCRDNLESREEDLYEIKNRSSVNKKRRKSIFEIE